MKNPALNPATRVMSKEGDCKGTYARKRREMRWNMDGKPLVIGLIQETAGPRLSTRAFNVLVSAAEKHYRVGATVGQTMKRVFKNISDFSDLPQAGRKTAQEIEMFGIATGFREAPAIVDEPTITPPTATVGAPATETITIPLLPEPKRSQLLHFIKYQAMRLTGTDLVGPARMNKSGMFQGVESLSVIDRAGIETRVWPRADAEQDIGGMRTMDEVMKDEKPEAAAELTAKQREVLTEVCENAAKSTPICTWDTHGASLGKLRKLGLVEYTPVEGKRLVKPTDEGVRLAADMAVTA